MIPQLGFLSVDCEPCGIHSAILRFRRELLPRHGGGHDQEQSAKDVCGHAVLDGARGDGAGEWLTLD